ncbi:hypothetical protein J4226_02320 [Candidatus Pacearchaeota archaeon]|nr:hypothetical protein [Candidatus Pacearchaeota archaeon]
MEDKNLCLNLEGAISQREEERKRGLEDKGTQGFEDTGCYKCNGYDAACPGYISLNTLEDM